MLRIRALDADRHRKTKTNESWCSRPWQVYFCPITIVSQCTRLCRWTLAHSVGFGWLLILSRTLWRDRNKTQTVLLESGQSSGGGTLGAVTSVVVNAWCLGNQRRRDKFSLKGMEEDKGNDALYRQWWLISYVWWNQCFSVLNNVWVPFKDKFSPTQLCWPKPIYRLNSKRYTYTVFIW